MRGTFLPLVGLYTIQRDLSILYERYFSNYLRFMHFFQFLHKVFGEKDKDGLKSDLQIENWVCPW